MADKLEQSEVQLCRGGFMLGMDTHEKKSEDKLAKATKDGWVISLEICGFTPWNLILAGIHYMFNSQDVNLEKHLSLYVVFILNKF